MMMMMESMIIILILTPSTISSLSPVPGSHPPEARYSGTELVMLYDYKAQVC